MGLLAFLRRAWHRLRGGYDPGVGVCSDLTAEVTQGVHADAGNTQMNPLIVTTWLDAANVRDDKAGGAYYFLRLNGIDVPGQLNAQANSRQACRERGYQPVVIFNPFASTPGNPAATANFLLGVQQLCDQLHAEPDVIVLLLNLNVNTWTGTAAEAYTIEGKGIKVLQDNGRRWAAHTDRGIAEDVATITDRIAAWEAEGVDPEGCEFLGVHEYVLAGFVMAHVLLAQDSLARVGVTYPIVLVEFAWDFVHQNAAPPLNTRAGRPDLFLPPATTWTRWGIAWCRHHGVRYGLFDAPMLYNSNGSRTSLGLIMEDEAMRQPTWVEPSPAEALATGGYDTVAAANKAYNLRLNNNGDAGAAATAAQRIVDGYLFSR